MMHKDYLETHRCPRTLFVADDAAKYPIRAFTLTTGLECKRLQFMVRGLENLHVLVPAHYPNQTVAESIMGVVQQAAREQRPYDLVITENVERGREIATMTVSEAYKPAIMVFRMREEEAKTIREKEGIPAFCPPEMEMEGDRRAIYDEQAEHAFGQEGIARLACSTVEESAMHAYHNNQVLCREVSPPGCTAPQDVSNKKRTRG